VDPTAKLEVFDGVEVVCPASGYVCRGTVGLIKKGIARIDLDHPLSDDQCFPEGAALHVRVLRGDHLFAFTSSVGEVREQALLVPAPISIVPFNRRSDVRVVCDISARWGPIDGEVSHRARIRNISAGGAFIECTDELPEDEPIAIEFDLGDEGEPIQATMRPRHVRSRKRRDRTIWQAGLQFEDISPHQRRRIFRFVMQLLRERAA
jgi:c-di-GMP-binding flagellar brake protein YcgR